MTTPCHVMLIEDDACLRDTLREILELEGFTVLAAGHGREGLDLLQTAAHPPALILLDLMMPIMNGWEFLEAIKGDPQSKHAAIPVIVVSAAASMAGGLERLHGCRLMSKPVDIEQLIGIVRQHCLAA